MSESPLPTDPETPEEADDEIIGRAFKASLLVLAAAGVLTAAIYLLLREDAAPPPVSTVDVAPPQAPRPSQALPSFAFRDVTAEAGIDFVHVNGARGAKLLPETMGGGCAFFDPDLDGDADLVLVNGCTWPGDPPLDPPPTSAFYRSRGDGTFENATRGSGIDVTLYGMGAASADADCDGDPDLYLTAVGSNLYLENDGTRFVAKEVGLSGGAEEWSTCASFFDAERDGDLDLFVGNYVEWSPDIDRAMDYRLTGVGRAYGPPVNYRGTHPRLFLNRGDGTFEDASGEAGIRIENPATGEPVAKTLGVVPTDLDLDGDTDLVVANDTVRNFLFLNRGDGTFEETASLVGVGFDRQGRATGAMGIDVAEFRDDGSVGIAIGNFANEMTSLYVSQRTRELFLDEAIGEGIGAPSRRVLSFGVLFLDLDLDGRLDLVQANGHLENEISKVQASQSYEQPPQLFWNAGAAGERTFVEVPAARCGDLARPAVGRALAAADIDGDGDLDLLLTQVGRRPRLLRNDTDPAGHWIRLRLRDAGCNPDALGARVELEAGGRRQAREVCATHGYLTQLELPLTFGLGDAERVDRVRIVWPDGGESVVKDLAVDRTHELRREP